ncbi:MAG TPA: hypothetical protein VL424_08915 [Pararobbsia sp.]|nr:hypothetical protein [Pararobbsia sp.]
MSADRWRCAQRVVIVVMGLGSMPAQIAGQPVYDPVQRNVRDLPALTPSRDLAGPSPRPGPGGEPDPSRKTFVTPPSMRDPNKSNLQRQGVSMPPGVLSPVELFNRANGYPFSSPTGFDGPPDAGCAGKPRDAPGCLDLLVK